MITAHYCDKQTGRESTVTWHVRRRAWTVTVYDLETGRYLDPVIVSVTARRRKRPRKL